MKVAIDISPLSTGHSIRGVGFYLQRLKDSLEKYYPKESFLYFNKKSDIPSDVDIIHYPYFDPFSFSLSLRKKIKTVVTVHDLTPLIFPNNFPPGIKGKIKWHFQKKALQKVDAVITDSNASKKDIHRIINIPLEKIHTIYLAPGEQFRVVTNQSLLRQVKEKYQLPDVFALYVGDVTWNKNLPRIVKAALRTNIPLYLVGKTVTSSIVDKKNKWNESLREVQELISHNPRLHTLGFIPDDELVALYNLASVFIMPSLYEGFGLPIAEAMACGCPVITSANGSIPEIVGSSAYMVDSGDIDIMAQAIQKIVGDKKLAKNLREKGLQQIKKFTWEKTATQTVAVYKSLTDKK